MGKHCKTDNEIQAIKPYVEIFYVGKIGYFDVNNYDGDPIKHSYKSFQFYPTDGLMSYSIFSLSQNIAVLHDSLWSDSFGVKNYTFSSLDIQ